MKTRIYQAPFYLIKSGGYMDYYTCEYKGIILVKKSIVGNCKEIMTGFNEFYDQSILCPILRKSYDIKDKNSYIRDDVQKNGFAFVIDKSGIGKDKDLATIDDIEKYEQEFDNSLFYDYYKKLHIFSKDEKRKIKDKVKKIEGSRRIL